MADEQAEGPVVPKRILVGGPPSGLPDKPLVYPGKPLAHRFIPTEQVRRVEETRLTGGTKLATDIPFKPIVSVVYPDKNIHLAPVSNVRARGLQPVPLSGSVTLPTSDVGVFELSEELRRPLEARLDSARQARASRLAVPIPKESPPAPKLKAPTSQKEGPATTPKLEATRTELEKIKELALEELGKRHVEKPSEPLVERPAAEKPAIRLAFPVKDAALPAKSAGVPEVTTVTGTEEETKRLLSEAERLETELAALRQGTLVKEEAREAQPPPKATSEVNNQVNQLILDKAELLKKVGELSATYNEEAAKRGEAESKLANLTKDFEGQLQKIRVEKSNLADRLRTLEEDRSAWQQKQALFEKQAGELAQLQARLATAEEERNDATAHLQKLEGLLEDIRRGHTATKEPETVVKPEIVAPEKPPPSTARIIKPQAAIGRMAPSLTSAPNVINGIIKDAAGMLLSNVIIVVQDEKGEPVRALKTNKIGQFAISTPLPNGTYTMELETAGHSFDIIQVEVKGKVLPPIEIRANN